MAEIQPQEVEDVLLAFPAGISHLMPTDIPKDFPDKDRWISFVSGWFFCGLKNPEFHLQDGVDGNAAVRHIRVILGSFEPQHEDKEEACAYLCSLWFTKVSHDG